MTSDKHHRYNTSEKGRERQRRYQRRYRLTERGRANERRVNGRHRVAERAARIEQIEKELT